MATFNEIAATVTETAAEVSRLLKELQLPEPSFNEDSASSFDPRQHAAVNNEQLRQARNALINATQDLNRLTMGPIDHITSMAWSAAEVSNLGAIVRLDLPSKIPRGSSRELKDLIAELGLPDFVVTSIIRYAISNGIFYEPSPGVIAHTAASARLATDRDIHDYSRMASAEISSLLVAIPEMVAQKQELKDDGPSSAAPIAFPGYNNIFEYFGTKPEAAQRYFTFLAARSRFPRWSADFLVEAWDWKSLGEGPVVDVGGSAGSSSIVLAKALPNVKFVVQDNSAEALQGGEALTKSQNLQERITFSEHDFFTPQPVKAKAFLFKNILHDWPHADCVKMIRALLPALEEGAHVLVGESIMPDPPASRISAWDDHAIRVEEQLMIAAHGACERTLEQFQAIFQDASEKLHYKGVTRGPDGSFFSLVDFVYSG